MRRIVCCGGGKDDNSDRQGETTHELRDVVSGRGFSGEEDDLRVDLLALLRSHVLEREVPLQHVASASDPHILDEGTYVDNTHGVEGFTLSNYHQKSFTLGQ